MEKRQAKVKTLWTGILKVLQIQHICFVTLKHLTKRLVIGIQKMLDLCQLCLGMPLFLIMVKHQAKVITLWIGVVQNFNIWYICFMGLKLLINLLAIIGMWRVLKIWGMRLEMPRVLIKILVIGIQQMLKTWHICFKGLVRLIKILVIGKLAMLRICQICLMKPLILIMATNRAEVVIL